MLFVMKPFDLAFLFCLSAHKRYTELLSKEDLTRDLSNVRVPMKKIHTLPELKVGKKTKNNIIHLKV